MANNIFYLKKNDTYPNVEATLSDVDGPIDLTDCTVKFRMSLPALDDKFVEKDATVVMPQTGADVGKVYAEFVDGDTDTIGTYSVEWKVTFPNAKVATFPRGTGTSFNQIVIQEVVV